MKIKISNLGPIHDEAQFELKPLTILIGPNNSGKTWLAYTLAALFGKFGISRFTDEERTASILENYPPVASTVDELVKSGIASMDICRFADAYGETYFNEVVSCIRENFSQFMGTQLVSFDTLQMSIKIDDIRPMFLTRIQDTSFRASIGLSKQESDNTDVKQNAPFTIRKQKGRKNINMYFAFEDQSEAKIPREIIEERIIWYVFRTLHCALFSDIVVQPAERTMLAVFPFPRVQEMDKGILAQNTNPQVEPNSRPMSWPLGEYLSFVMSVSSMGSTQIASRERDPQTKPYVELSYLLEEHILNRNVALLPSEPAPDRDILFSPTETSKMELRVASSMVKELSPLVFHLRYFAQPNELLIIDEPEMNLHPTAQVQMLEFLAMLVNANINVLVTTHSPYIIDHLANLTKASQHPDKERIQSEFYLKDHRAFIDEKKVSMYFVDKGTVQDALHDEEVDWNTFAHVSDRLTEIFFLL